MKQQLPSNLRLLLETPLEEELYLEWATLLETLIISYVPPACHLSLCMTLVVHPRSEVCHALQASCYRILLRTFALYGSRPFIGALEFRSARQKRRKIRHSSLGLEREANDGEELSSVPLATTDSVFSQFSNVWDLISCGFSQDEQFAHPWLQISQLLCTIMEDDWHLAVVDKLDLSKSLVVKLLRSEDDKYIDLRKVVRTIFARPTDQVSWIGDPFRDSQKPMQKETWRLSHKIPLGIIGSIPIRQKLIVLMYKISRSHRLNIIDESDLTSSIASTIATMPIRSISDIFQIRYAGHEREILMASLELCNALLFRLAAYPGKVGAKHHTVDWKRIQGWCIAEARSNDKLEASTVEYLKCTIFLAFLQLHKVDLSQAEIEQTARNLSEGLADFSDHVLKADQPKDEFSKDSYGDLLIGPSGLISMIDRYQKVIQAYVSC